MSATTELQAPDHYVFDNAWEHARQRLTLLEQCTDASTIRRLRSLGVQPGWRCLEAGGGAGSIARWLCSQVGPTGRVLAADLDTHFLGLLDEPNLDVQRMDLRSDELPRGSFDLIHARALLMHIPQRAQILDGLVAALRPGGVLLLEDADHFPLATLNTGLYAEVFEAFLDSAVRAGMAKDWARHLPTELCRRGLRDIWADCEAPLFEGGSPYSEFWRLTLSQARDLVVAEGINRNRLISGTASSVNRAAGSRAWPSSPPADGAAVEKWQALRPPRRTMPIKKVRNAMSTHPGRHRLRVQRLTACGVAVAAAVATLAAPLAQPASATPGAASTAIQPCEKEVDIFKEGDTIHALAVQHCIGKPPNRLPVTVEEHRCVDLFCGFFIAKRGTGGVTLRALFRSPPIEWRVADMSDGHLAVST